MTGYEFDIFISYRRGDKGYERWMREHFVGALKSLLFPALGRVEFFIDQDYIDIGATWPPRLAQALARSRLMIPILCQEYFRSDWCCKELAIMYRREQNINLRTVANPGGLIIPVIISDGDQFPPEIRRIEGLRIHDYSSPFLCLTGSNYENFTELLRTKLCPDIETAFDRVPPFDRTWEQICNDEFEEVFRIKEKSQTTVPRMSFDFKNKPDKPDDQ